MNWKELKAFCNALSESELNEKVILWRESEAITKIEAEQLEEDHYIQVESPEEGCFPVSEAKHFDTSIKIKRVYLKGHPILHELF